MSSKFLTDEEKREQEIKNCKACQENKGKFYPHHFASNSCESGKRNHCTCDICF